LNKWCIWLERLSAATLKIKKIAGKSRTPERLHLRGAARVRVPHNDAVPFQNEPV
jgi:hypothetical protein